MHDVLDLLVGPARLTLGGVLLVSAWSKARSPVAFAKGIKDYGILPSVSYLLGLILIPAEALVGSMVITGRGSPIGTLGALALFSSFAFGVAFNLLRGRFPRCFCFGATSGEQISPRSLQRIALLLCLVVITLRAELAAGSGVGWDLGSSSTLALDVALAGFIAAAGSWLLILPRPFHDWARIYRTRHGHRTTAE